MRIGLTGGIGSGKSTVARELRDKGALIIDADAISRQLMEPGQRVLAQTVEAFGQQILTETGELNRQALAQIIFSDEHARAQLNAIVHPAVREEANRIAQEASQDANFTGVIVEDIPLLAETGQADRFDAVLVVEADLETRIRRLVEARGMQEQDARARIAAQAKDEERRKIATWVVDNSGDFDTMHEQVEKIWQKIQVELERKS